MWHVETGECIKTFEGHNSCVFSVCFSSDGKKIASGSWDKTVRVWNVETGECIKTFEGHNSSVWSVCFSSDGKKIASGSWDKTVRVWHVETGECIKTFEGHNGSFILFASAAMERRLRLVLVTMDGSRVAC